jgi:hypothetical protein
VKAKLYARFGVEHCWIVDPVKCALDAFALRAGAYAVIGTYSGADQVTVAPFPDLTLDLATVWRNPGN